VVASRTLGTRALVELSGGAVVVAEQVPVRRLDEMIAKWRARAGVGDSGGTAVDGQATPRVDGGGTLVDARCLAVRSAGGERWRDWASVARECQEIEMDNWPVEGPRSAAWVVGYLARMGHGGPEGYHRWWRMVSRLSLVDWGVAEHAQLLRYLQLAGCWDQLDVSNLAVVEAICRRLQLIEYQYRERSREGARTAGGVMTGAAGSVAGAAALHGEEVDLFDGIGRVAGGVCVAPNLTEWIAGELERTSRIDKQARKAREERALLQSATGASGAATGPPGQSNPGESGGGGGKRGGQKK